MCAYNVRKNKRVDYDPATGDERTRHQLQEIVLLLLGVVAMYSLYLLARLYLPF